MVDSTCVTEVVECDFCSSSESKIFDELLGWTIAKCANCGFCYTNPRPMVEYLPKLYSEEYYKDERHRDHYYNYDGSLRTAEAPNSKQRMIDIESHSFERGSILEIGSARGEFLAALKKRGWKVAGVEISADAVKFAKEHNDIELFNGIYEDFDDEARFDVICMYQTLEHVPSPRFVIDKAYKQLNENGILVIEVPNLNSFDLKINRNRKRLSYDLPRHLSHFTPEFLGTELTSRGFKVVDIDLYHCSAVLRLVAGFNKLLAMRKSVGKEVEALENEKEISGNEYRANLEEAYPSWKARWLRSISNILPGWRFTIIAAKVGKG